MFSEADLARMAIQRQVKAGVRVRLTKAMGVKEGCVTYCHGVVKKREGGDNFIVTVEYSGQDRNARINGIDCHRYLCEIEEAFINNEWVKVWPK